MNLNIFHTEYYGLYIPCFRSNTEISAQVYDPLRCDTKFASIERAKCSFYDIQQVRQHLCLRHWTYFFHMTFCLV